MELCSIGHEEVCYTGHFCPACTVKGEMQEDLNKLRDELDDEKSKTYELEALLREANRREDAEKA
jgi:hypothetical protein